MGIVVEGEILEERARDTREVCLEVADTCNALSALAAKKAKGRDARYWTGVALAFHSAAWMALAPLGQPDGNVVLEKAKAKAREGL